MGYLDQSHACDRGEHDTCDGTVTIMDQDGRSAYVCKCLCHQRKADQRCEVEGHVVAPKLTQRCACCGQQITYKPVPTVRSRAPHTAQESGQ